MNKARPVRVTKVRQEHSAVARTKPGKPSKGANLVPQHAASEKKTARKTSRSKKASK